MVNESPAVTRIELPPDVNCLLSVDDHSLKSTGYISVIVCDKQKHLQFLDMDAAVKHCTKGIGIWDWASNDQGAEPDVVMASAGDVPTKEALAAVVLLRENFPGYPWLIHRLAYRRSNHKNFHVRGYKEKGSITTPLE